MSQQPQAGVPPEKKGSHIHSVTFKVESVKSVGAHLNRFCTGREPYNTCDRARKRTAIRLCTLTGRTWSMPSDCFWLADASTNVLASLGMTSEAWSMNWCDQVWPGASGQCMWTTGSDRTGHVQMHVTPRYTVHQGFKPTPSQFVLNFDSQILQYI